MRMFAAGVFLILLVSSCSSGGTAKSSTSAPVVAPVVATSFSNLRPSPGQQEMVKVQFFKGRQHLAGGKLSATVTYGSHAVRLKGGSTNKQGLASVAFTVPKVKKGTVLHATTTVAYKGHRYMGSNQVTVEGK